MTEKTKNEIKNDVVRLGWCTVGLAMGYIVGTKIATMKFYTGLKVCWVKDPTLKTHMEEVLSQVTKK